jgi:hypothetical protein
VEAQPLIAAAAAAPSPAALAECEAASAAGRAAVAAVLALLADMDALNQTRRLWIKAANLCSAAQARLADTFRDTTFVESTLAAEHSLAAQG